MTTEPDLILLKGLRATTLANMSDTDYADLERLVAEKGIRNIDGWLGSAVRKAVTEVLKHPGHASQASHGGGKGGGGGSSSKGGFSRSKSDRERLDNNVRDAGFDPKAKVKRHDANSDKMLTALGTQGGGSGYHGERRSARSSGKDTTAADKMLVDHAAKSGWSMRQLHEFADSKNGRFFGDIMFGGPSTARNAAQAQAILDGGALGATKSAQPVQKHPGHGDQKVHGGGRRGGAAGSPAAAGGGGGEITRADEARMQVSQAGTQASERMVDHANEMSQTIYGGKTYIGIIDSIDSVELMGISDALTNAATSVTMLPPGRDKSFKEISNIRGTLKDADMAARSIRNKTAQRAARRAIRLSQEELTALQKVHRESWSGVGGVFGD